MGEAQSRLKVSKIGQQQQIMKLELISNTLRHTSFRTQFKQPLKSFVGLSLVQQYMQELYDRRD